MMPGTSGGAPVAPSLAISAPSGIALGRSGPVSLTVKLARQGNVGAANVTLTGLPAGFTSSAVMVGATSSDATLTIRASDAATASPVNATIEATAAGGITAKAPLRVVAAKGTFDATFGSAGIASLPMRGVDALPLDDGGVLAFGSLQTGLGGATLLRLDAAGVANASFGSKGTFSLPLAAGTSGDATAVAAKGDGTFYALERVSANTSSGPTIVHVLANGSIDTTFGASGFATVAFDGWSDVFPTGIAVQADGKVVVVGTAFNDSGTTSPHRAVAARFSAGGQLDAGFGTGGRVATIWTSATGTANGVRIIDGKAHVFGSSATTLTATSTGVIARLDDAGGLDATFGASGIIAVSTPVDDVAKTPGGKLLMRISNTNGFDGYVQQVSLAGDLDTSFGSAGYLLNTSPLPDAGYASDRFPFAIDDAGRLHFLIGSVSHKRLEAWAFDATGQRDTAFGVSGSLLADTPGENPNPIVIRATSDGRLIALGNMPTSGAPSVLMRFFP